MKSDIETIMVFIIINRIMQEIIIIIIKIMIKIIINKVKIIKIF